MKTEFLLLILIVIAITMEPVCLAGRRRRKGRKKSQKTGSNKANKFLNDFPLKVNLEEKHFG